jgi:hypothetical protein
MENEHTNNEGGRRTQTIIMAVALAAGLLFGWIIDDLAFGLLIGFLVSLPFTSRFSRQKTLMEYPPGTLPRIAASGVTGVRPTHKNPAGRIECAARPLVRVHTGQGYQSVG